MKWIGNRILDVFEGIGGVAERRDLWYFVQAVAWQIAIAAMLGWALQQITGLTWAAYYAGAWIWALVLMLTPASRLWFIRSRQNQILVLENIFTKMFQSTEESVAMQEANTKLRANHQLRAIIGPQAAGKLPWQSFHTIVNTARAVSLSEEPLKAYTKDTVPVTITYQVWVTPINDASGAVNLARHTEPYVLDYFRKEFSRYVQSLVRELSADELLSGLFPDPDDPAAVLGGKDFLDKKFRDFLGGPKKISEIEREHGVFSGRPSIATVILDLLPENAMQMQALSVRAADAIKTLIAGGFSRESATNMVANMLNKPQLETVIRYIGLENAGHIAIVANPRNV